MLSLPLTCLAARSGLSTWVDTGSPQRGSSTSAEPMFHAARTWVTRPGSTLRWHSLWLRRCSPVVTSVPRPPCARLQGRPDGARAAWHGAVPACHGWRARAASSPRLAHLVHVFRADPTVRVFRVRPCVARGCPCVSRVASAGVLFAAPRPRARLQGGQAVHVIRVRPCVPLPRCSCVSRVARARTDRAHVWRRARFCVGQFGR